MARRPAASWLPRFLFRATFLVAALLTLLVLFSPLIDNEPTHGQRVTRWLALFARDVTLRRTAIASAIGLGVTASIFYRPQIRPRPPRPRPLPAAPTSENIVGA